MNAEAGARKDREWAGEMGEHGDKRRTKEGEKLLEWRWREETEEKKDVVSSQVWHGTPAGPFYDRKKGQVAPNRM